MGHVCVYAMWLCRCYMCPTYTSLLHITYVWIRHFVAAACRCDMFLRHNPSCAESPERDFGKMCKDWLVLTKYNFDYHNHLILFGRNRNICQARIFTMKHRYFASQGASLRNMFAAISGFFFMYCTTTRNFVRLTKGFVIINRDSSVQLISKHYLKTLRSKRYFIHSDWFFERSEFDPVNCYRRFAFAKNIAQKWTCFLFRLRIIQVLDKEISKKFSK